MNAADTFGVRGRARRDAPIRSAFETAENAEAVPIRTRPRRIAPDRGIQEKIRAAEALYGMKDKEEEPKSYRARDRIREAARRSRAKRAAEQAAKAPQGVGRQGFTGKQRRAGGEEAYQTARAGKRRHAVRNAVLVILLCGVFALGVLAVVYKLIYVISDVQVEGVSRYTEEEIVEASGVAVGDNLYSFSSRRAAARVIARCPYAAEVRIARTAPSRVVFTVTEETAVFYTEIYGEVRALTGSLRVLERTTVGEAEARGLIRLCLPQIDEAVAGRQLVFGDVKEGRTIREVLSLLGESALHDRVTAIDLRNLFGVCMICDGRFRLTFGDTDSMALKLKIADAVLEDDIFRAGIRASVDLTQMRSTSVVLDNQLDLDF